MSKASYLVLTITSDLITLVMGEQVIATQSLPSTVFGVGIVMNPSALRSAIRLLMSSYPGHQVIVNVPSLSSIRPELQPFCVLQLALCLTAEPYRLIRMVSLPSLDHVVTSYDYLTFLHKPLQRFMLLSYILVMVAWLLAMMYAASWYYDYTQLIAQSYQQANNDEAAEQHYRDLRYQVQMMRQEKQQLEQSSGLYPALVPKSWSRGLIYLIHALPDTMTVHSITAQSDVWRVQGTAPDALVVMDYVAQLRRYGGRVMVEIKTQHQKESTGKEPVLFFVQINHAIIPNNISV